MSVVVFAPPVQAPAPEPVASEVYLALERVLSSARFSRSERLRRFLEFIVREKLAGRGGDLKEYTIATEVYDRGPGFNPATDTIVRVEARRLRTMLQAYYGDGGNSDPIRIEVPKGGYAPSFCRRSLTRGFSPPVTPSSSVAVLPFKDLSANREREYFCQGLTEEIICALTQVEGLKVAGPTGAAMADANPRDVSDGLRAARNCTSVVDGSVRHADNRVRITAQLISTVNGYHLWSRRFEREIKDPFAVQDEVAAAVVEAVCRQR